MKPATTVSRTLTWIRSRGRTCQKAEPSKEETPRSEEGEDASVKQPTTPVHDAAHASMKLQGESSHE